MNPTASVQNFGTNPTAREQLKAQLEQYLAQQPESTLAAHQWMKRLEAAGAGIVVAVFVVALYVSIMWKSVNPLMIPVAWFAFAASVAPALIFYGLDAIILRAFPTTVVPGKSPRFVTGNIAVWIGLGFIVLALLTAGFWGVFAYAVGTFNMAMLKPLITLLANVMGIGMTIAILYSIFQKITKSR